MQPEQQQRIMGYFIEEAKDHLNTIEQGLVNLQSTIEDSEMVNEVFRAAHSVKGGAAMLGINSIQRTSHRLEDCFKVLKECPVKIDQKLESLFLKVSDTLKELIEQLSGPFGLTEEIANGIMSGVEPVFEELNQHMAFLVNGAGGNVSLEAASGAQEAGTATAAGGYLRDGQAQKRFQSDVLNQLREMLQLFKQTDQPRCRQQLQEICGSLERMGEQYECPKWSELIQASASAIANPENSYRTLATVVIKEIKQAQELVLAGRASSIEPSSQLNALLPSSATPSLLEQLDAEPSLIYSAQELAGATTADLQTRIASVQSQHSMTPAEAGTRQSRPKATDRFNYSETFIQEERFAAGESGAGLKEPSLTSANSDTTFSQPSIKSGRGKESANHPADPNGPEVGMAELNSLADLFEGEAPDLDETWQEEQVIGDGAENMGTERQEWLNLEQENDFSDLLGGDTDGLGKSATPATEEDDLTLFGFGEDLVEEGETPSAESEREDAAQLFAGSVSDGNGDEDDFSDLLFAADAPSAASEATPSENLANLWSDSFLEDEGFEQQENANLLSESLAAATDEDLLGILTSENLDLALLATESEALESDSDEDLFGAAGIDTNENDSIEAAASQESSDWELMTTGTLFGEAAENSNQEVSEELETPSIMSIEGSDWTTDWSSEDLQVLDSVAAAEPIATTGNDLPDFVFEDEQSTSTALTGDLEMGSLLEDEVDLTAAGWEEEPDFSNLDLFETPHARADNGDVLEELMLDDNTDLWLEETMPRNETNDLLDLSAAIGTPFESEAIAPEIEADAVGDVNLDFNWPAIPGVEDIDASTSSVDRAFLEDWSATDLAWDERIQPAGFSEVTAAQMPGTAREDLEDWENQLEFNETLVEEPFSALDDLDIPSNWASPDAFALDTSASDARNEEALDLLELDNPQTSPFSLDWESEAESTGSEIENLALQEDADANGALNAVPNLTETVSVDELGDFFGSQAAELETTEFASLDESLDMNGESHEVPQLDALDNFFEAEPEATATTEWDSSLDFASMSLSDGNTDAFDASLGEPLSSLFDPSQEESLVSADSSDDFFAATDAFLELPSEETSQGSLDAAENLETMLGDEPSSSTDALDALDLNEENLLATEFDAEWGIDSAAVPVDAAFELDEDLLDSSLPAEAPENLEAMFGEAPAPTPEALELADSDLFGSDMDDAEWGIDLAAVPVESDNLKAMFGEEASSAPTPEALELADSDLFSSEPEAEWGIDLAAMPVESENLEAMFGEEASPALTPEALELSDSDLFGSETEAEWGIDLAAVPTEAPENLEVMFGEEASSASTPEALELSDSDLFGSETEAEWGIDLAAMPVESDNLEAMFGEEASSAPTPEALELADSDLFGSETSETEAEWGIDLAAVPVESENLEAMFGEASAPTPEALELADSDLFGSETEAEWGIDLAAVPVESENLEAMFGEQEAPTPEALELSDSDLFGSETEAEWGIDLAAVPVESENLEAMFGEEASPALTPEALELADSDLFGSDMDDAGWGIDSAAVSQEAASELEDLLGSEPVEFGDGLDFQENLLIGEISSENQASDADELKEVDDLWDLVTEQQEIANPSEAAVADELSLLETVGEQDQDLAISLVENDEFDELEAMLGEEVFAEPASNLASNDEFDELEALLGEEESVPAAFDAEDMNEFADLEALLGDDEPQLVPQFAQSQRSPTKPIAETATSADALDDGFGDLEELLGQAEETMGGPRSVKTSPGQVRPVNRPRPVKVFEQTMRVPVKHLDNLSNLVGELVVNRNTLEQDQERLRQFLDNLLHQVQQLSDVGARMQDRYERSLLESSLLASRQSNRFNARPDHTSAAQEAPANSRFGLGELELDLFTPFHSLSQEIIELIVRVRESAADIEFLVDETDQVARMLRQVTTQLQEGLTRSRMVPFAQTADRLPRAVREISLKCGKQAELQIEGRETLIDKVILEHLYDPMTHLVNNAITHGIEPPEVRIAAGKPPVGRITIRAFHQGNQTVISVSDDGAGIDSERVKAKAVEKGLITTSEAKSMTRLEVYDLLFHPGFSTKDKADDFSGRGVGMDVVCTSLNEIRGVITTDSTLGKGTTFTVRLPLTLSICKALCCLSDKARIAFPMDGVEDMLDVPQDRIQTNSEGETCISWRDSLMPFQPLEELLTYQRHLSRGTVYGGNREDDMISVVVLRSAGNFIAVQVDQVLGEQEIVIKQLEGPVPKPLGVAGATVLGDGRIMPIADVLELIDLATGRIGKDRNVSLWDKAGVSLPVEAPAVKTDPMVLIVDDSITVRELLSMTFNKAGYRVEQARDGQEAWDKLRSGLPCEIVFCDIEMPRMDGLELLSRIQKDPSLNHLPVAMLTSRGASKHQQMAAQLGAKGYFTKPYLEEALLDAAQRMIKGEVLLSINTNA
ncbi:hybrid sensor histidine kinase/response regulator [Coleofasciculus sp. FACHB-501]|uniref:hybrid sensor histidine kinase/response regulator n=1 Tax=Cyanophyceae TaxID=3028117 RepID=UPI0018EF41F4|nr:hybrid sensor histidine kinase/response regulator [Coleofasciculus sp. FACHB-501]